MRSEVNSGAWVTFNCILTSNVISQPLTSCIIIVTSFFFFSNPPVILRVGVTEKAVPYLKKSCKVLIKEEFGLILTKER